MIIKKQMFNTQHATQNIQVYQLHANLEISNKKRMLSCEHPDKIGFSGVN
jgi:hypothetical protein